MNHRGRGNYGVKVEMSADNKWIQWFESPTLRNEYYGNLCRGPKYRGAKLEKVDK